MTSSRKYAEKAAAALGTMLKAGTDSGKVADIVESVLADATRGAFMTLIAWGLLDRMLRGADGDNPSKVLTGLHRGVQSLLGQNEAQGETDDGLEAGMCFINLKKRKMTFSGARFSLWRANRKGVIEIKGDRKGLPALSPRDHLHRYRAAVRGQR